MNNISLIGRITRDLELRTTASDKSVCEFTLAVNRYTGEEADFITVQVWGKQADNLCKYQGKGSQIAVVGSYRVDTYKDKEDNTRYKHYILANQIEYLSKSNNAERVIDNEPEESFNNDFDNITLTNDDLPF